MKRIFLLLTICIVALTAGAVPALRTPFSLTLADGTTVMAMKCGDETCHWLQTTDGNIIINTARGLAIATHEEQTREEERITQTMTEARRRTRRRAAAQSLAVPTKGQMHSLVILVNFSDKAFVSPTAHDDFQRMMMQDGYSENGGTGSAHDFYMDSSMGAFDPQFDVVGPVTLSKPYSYYGANTVDGYDANPEEMIIEACQLADSDIDFSLYDSNGDGLIDNVFVFYAGHGEATYSDGNTIWPHSHNIMEYTSTPYLFDGKRLAAYACTNELTRTGSMDGIGTFVHEFGHVLGLPDLYSTSYTGAFTPGAWSVMDQGEYNNGSRTPPLFTAFERYMLGWIQPLVLEGPSSLVIKPLSENDAYIIKTGNTNEYFLLENRQQKGWDRYIPGHGMLVWHIDYDERKWVQNIVNDDIYHQSVDIIEADDIATTSTRRGDAFPGSSNVTALTPETAPSLTAWNGKPVLTDPRNASSMPFALTNIREINGIIILDVCGGGDILTPFMQVVPVAEEAQEVTPTAFTAAWNAIDDAENYTLSVGSMGLSAHHNDLEAFDNGLSSLGEAWATTATSMYNNASYAGLSYPSLRMTTGGQVLECRHDRIFKFSFWYRGVSMAADGKMAVEALGADGEWQTVAEVMLADNTIVAGADAITVTPSGRGNALCVTIGDAIECSAVRIIFEKGDGSDGSLAIDDADVEYADCQMNIERTINGITGCSYVVDNLTPKTQYAYSIRGVRGTETTKPSNVITLTTLPASDAISSIMMPVSGHDALYNIHGQRVSQQYRGIVIMPDGTKRIKK